MATPAQRGIMAAKGYITASDAAEATGSHITTFYKWVREGSVLGSRIGRHWFVEVRSVVKHLGGPKMDASILKRLHETLRKQRTIASAQ